MPNILILSGSPINGGSTEILLEKIAEAITANSVDRLTTELIRINDFNFIPCQSCGKSPQPDYCFFHDDIYPIYEKLIDCDIVLFGSPIYFDSVSAQAKLFIDRCNCLRPASFDELGEHPFKKILNKQRLGGIVLVGGHRGEFELARKVIAGLFKWVDVTSCGLVTFEAKGWDKGAVKNDPSALAQAAILGNKIALRMDEKSP